MAMSTAQWFASGPPPTYDTHSFMSTSSLRPYLQLPHLLSLTWLAYPIVSLAFVAFRIYLSLGSANDAIANAKNNLLASCRAAETAATSAASMPRYLAIASNEQFVDAVNGTLNAAREALVLALTAMEAIVNFIIDTYRSTLLCFLELIVRTAFELLLGAVNELNSALSSVANGLSESIQKDISSANSVIQSAIDGVNKINPFGKITAPQIPVPDLSSLQNVKLPDSFTQRLNDLNSSLPTVAQLKSEIESIIDKPFELLKKDINDTFAGISFNSSILPVPKQNNVVFCGDMDLSVVDELGRDIIATAKIGIVLLVVLAVVLTGLNCLVEWYKWRCLKRHLVYTRQAWMSDPTILHVGTAGVPTLTMDDHNLMILNADTAHPLLTRMANSISKFLRLSPSKHTNLRWFFNYIFHQAPLACLLVGVIGLLSVELQLLAMKPLVAKFRERSAGAASSFSNMIATSINNSMYNQSAVYANGVNNQIDAVQNTLNQGVFGWVNVTTTTLNSTVNTFYNDVQKVVNTVFGGTIFASPANEFVRCFIGSKVDAVENALTFLHDNLVVNMPRVNESALVLSQNSVNEVTMPIATAAIGGGTSGKRSLLETIIDSYAASLRKERLMFGIFIGLWVIVVLMGLCFIFWNSYGRRWRDFWKLRRSQSAAFNNGKSGGDEKSVSPRPSNRSFLPSLTPLPSPSPAGRGSSRSSDTDDGWGKAFKERFAGTRPRKLRPNGRKPLKEQLVSDPSSEVNKDPAPSTWVRRMRSFPVIRKKEKSTDPGRMAVDVSNFSAEDSGNGSAREVSRWSTSQSSPTNTFSPWNKLRKNMPPPPPMPKFSPLDNNPIAPAPSTRIRQLLPVEKYQNETQFAPPLHNGFRDSRQPMRQTSRDGSARSPTPIPSPSVGLALTSPRQLQFQQLAAGAVAASPPSAWNGKVYSTQPSFMAAPLPTRHQQKQWVRPTDPFVTPFDDEHKVTIEQPTNPIKSFKTSPLDEGDLAF